jgi:glycosyltransferase involved in cell wall biosynthesis
MKPTISYLILAHGEIQVFTLIKFIQKYKGKEDDIVILNDPTTTEYEENLTKAGAKIVNHKLEYSYADHRNAALPFCKGEYVFALDADETATIPLMKCVKRLLKESEADLIWLPRLNIFEGVTQEDALKYGWTITDKNIINWDTGDLQTRLFRNDGRLQWQGNLHERIHPRLTTRQVKLEIQKDYCIVHRKDIVKQRQDNQRYNTSYSTSENMGIIQ